MTAKIDNHTQTRESSFKRLRANVEMNRLPYDFRQAIYKNDGARMKVKCLFGHTLFIKPYQLKFSDYNKNRDTLPQCWECTKNNITKREYKHRLDVWYGSDKEIEVIGTFNGINNPTKYRFTKNGYLFAMSPKDMNKILTHYPRLFRKAQNTNLEQIIMRKMDDSTRRGSR